MNEVYSSFVRQKLIYLAITCSIAAMMAFIIHFDDFQRMRKGIKGHRPANAASEGILGNSAAPSDGTQSDDAKVAGVDGEGNPITESDGQVSDPNNKPEGIEKWANEKPKGLLGSLKKTIGTYQKKINDEYRNAFKALGETPPPLNATPAPEPAVDQEENK
jgi:hypothetical protein